MLGKQLRGRGTRLRSVSGLSDLGTEVRLEKVERCQGGNSKHPNGLQVRRSHPLTQPLSLHSFHSYPPSLLLFRVTLAFPGWIFIYLSPLPLPFPSVSLRSQFRSLLPRFRRGTGCPLALRRCPRLAAAAAAPRCRCPAQTFPPNFLPWAPLLPLPLPLPQPKAVRLPFASRFRMDLLLLLLFFPCLVFPPPGGFRFGSVCFSRSGSGCLIFYFAVFLVPVLAGCVCVCERCVCLK